MHSGAAGAVTWWLASVAGAETWAKPLIRARSPGAAPKACIQGLHSWLAFMACFHGLLSWHISQHRVCGYMHALQGPVVFNSYTIWLSS
jgi:hypothetical protein